jgi:hypothetical protein
VSRRITEFNSESEEDPLDEMGGRRHAGAAPRASQFGRAVETEGLMLNRAPMRRR